MKSIESEANQEIIQVIAEPYKWAPCIKAANMLTALEDWASDVLQ
jgi:hypothetical protein